ncbi:MAG: chorismate synthase [Chitinophagales bacterium]
MLKILTAGESHGPALVALIDGLPAGVPVDTGYINAQLKRRQKGHGRGGRMQLEDDQIEILSGIRDSLTLGTPITFIIRNRDHANWSDTMAAGPAGDDRRVDRPRPGHADLAGGMKYGQHDLRNILERASARETAARVAAGAICRELLREFNIEIWNQVVAIGPVKSPLRGCSLDEDMRSRLESSPVSCPDPDTAQLMIEAIDKAREEGESLGGAFEVVASNVPPGLGSPFQADTRIDGMLAATLMSIPAIKAVEIGDGIEAAGDKGSAVHDEIYLDDMVGIVRYQNRAGGIEGGITNGETIVVRGYMKPIPTLYKPLTSVNMATWEAEKAQVERSDTCAVPAAGVVAEAVVGQILAREMMSKFGGDSLREMKANYRAYLDCIGKDWRWKRTLY